MYSVKAFAAHLPVGSQGYLVHIHYPCHDTNGIIVIDNGGIGRHDSFGCKHTDAVSVDIAYIHVSHSSIIDVGRNPICHSSCGAIGKREAEHIIIMHAVFIMRDAYSLGENLRLSASRRGKHEVVSTFYIYNILLTVVWYEGWHFFVV